MQTVTLTPKDPFRIPVEAETVTPDNFAGKSKEQIGQIEVWQGNRKIPLKDVFDISVEGTAAVADTTIIIDGSVPRVKRIGEGMSGGKIMINGDVDMHVGAKMKGGLITVKGNADSWAGREITGGELVIEGSAAYYVGSGYRGESCGMKGGKITVLGSVRDYLGEHMCGGEILVKGDAGLLPGISNSGGKIVIEGNTSMPGSEMKSGTIIVKGTVEDMVPVFKAEGTEAVDGVTYRKFTGDMVLGGKGVLYLK